MTGCLVLQLFFTSFLVIHYGIPFIITQAIFLIFSILAVLKSSSFVSWIHTPSSVFDAMRITILASWKSLVTIFGILCYLFSLVSSSVFVLLVVDTYFFFVFVFFFCSSWLLRPFLLEINYKFSIFVCFFLLFFCFLFWLLLPQYLVCWSQLLAF